MGIGSTFRMSDEAKLAARKEMITRDGRLAMHLAGLEQLLQRTGRVAGTSITVADIAIWRMAGWIDGGIIDGIPRGYVSGNFPKIAALSAIVDSDAKVQEWKRMHPKQYPASKL